MKLYKLTDENDRSFGGCQWGPGVTKETNGEGELCGPGFTHWHTDPLLAVLLNPIHGNYDIEKAHLWEGEGEVVKEDCGLKVGCMKATTIRRVEMPVVTLVQKVKFGILCALASNVADKIMLAWMLNNLGLSDINCDAQRISASATARAAQWTAWEMKSGLDLVALAHEAMGERKEAEADV